MNAMLPLYGASWDVLTINKCCGCDDHGNAFRKRRCADGGHDKRHRPGIRCQPCFRSGEYQTQSAGGGDDWGTQIRGHHFVATHITLQELISYAYGVNSHQVLHAPDWVAAERFDMDAVLNTEILPNRDQYRVMVRKALQERFGLAFHSDRRNLAVYVLSQAKGGLKLDDVSSEPYASAGWGVQQGLLNIKAMSFAGVAQVMQRTIFDRPVMDHTGLNGRYTFKLRWRPDETQFTQMQGLEVPTDEGSEARDDIFSSARKQLGIEIKAEHALNDVMVIDRVMRPGEN